MLHINQKYILIAINIMNIKCINSIDCIKCSLLPHTFSLSLPPPPLSLVSWPFIRPNKHSRIVFALFRSVTLKSTLQTWIEIDCHFIASVHWTSKQLRISQNCSQFNLLSCFWVYTANHINTDWAHCANCSVSRLYYKSMYLYCFLELQQWNFNCNEI